MQRDEFFKHVQSIAQLGSREEAERAVFSVLNTAVTPGEFADIRANLSPDYLDLLPSANPSSQVVSGS
ncbi:DUF2267 domain-containing protein [Phormidium sp. LEGE 05292]|uniref:DUF2267 domain-containing protein n=1 Tax=[Phormidium] sp. LEGE 05292 TaxID=767427 RepID=UPI00188179A1|nr:DUF2267 domain-containing protein [Phormidium sp. LEGE 05292]MBE9227983.1 DUF2267 domain-containing protein [Phormidium sp. LEGE 05292]